MDLNDKVVVITGASRGIGEGLARGCLERGMRVATCSRGEAAIADGDRSWSARVDVTDADALFRFGDEVVRRFGRVDLWVNNAGLLEPIAPFHDADLEEFRRLIDVNVLGVAYGTRWFVRHRRARGGDGVLINISSGAATSAYAGWSGYCASKAAVDRFTECVQLEEGNDLRAHAVAPGIVDTRMQELIRGTDEWDFPMVAKFREFKQNDAFNTPEFVTRELLNVAFDPASRPDSVVVRLPAEKG